jgi:hypothetical protein
MKHAKSEEVTSVLGERRLVRSPYRSCMATLKGWTLVRTDGRPRVKQGNASRKLGGRGREGEPPRSRKGGWEVPREGEAESGETPSGEGRDGVGGTEKEMRMGRVKGPEIPKTKRRGRERGRRRTRNQRDQGILRREAKEGAGVRRPKQAGRGETEEEAGYRIPPERGEPDRAEGEDDGEASSEAIESRSSSLSPPSLSSSLESIVSGGGESSSSSTEVAGSARRRERREEGRKGGQQ